MEYNKWDRFYLPAPGPKKWERFPTPPIRCIQCGSPIDENDPLEFAGGLACEQCVRDYYLDKFQRLYPEGSPSELESYLTEEGQYRRVGGKRTLKDFLKHRRRRGL